MADRPVAQAAAAGDAGLGIPGLSVLPVAIAVWFSFNAGRSRSSWQGFSLRWYWQDPVLSVWHDPELQAALVHSLRLATLTTLVAVPLGVAFAIGLDRWRGRLAAGFNFQMLLSFVLPRDPARGGPAVPVHQPAQGRPAGHRGPAARPGHLPALLPGDHLPGPAAVDRPRVRGGGHGSESPTTQGADQRKRYRSGSSACCSSQASTSRRR